MTAASADSWRHHPPGPDQCWAWHHHHWIWVCHRPYDWHHPELSFYFGFNDHRHHDRHDGDWKNKGDSGQMNGGDKTYKKQNDNGSGDNSSQDWKKKHPGDTNQ